MQVIVVPYCEEWPELYQTEAEEIRGILGENLVDIYHIGSTSVPGLAAKPIIDIMPVVRHIALVDTCNAAFEVLGYECMGEFGIPGRRYFRKGGDRHRRPRARHGRAREGARLCPSCFLRHPH